MPDGNYNFNFVKDSDFDWAFTADEIFDKAVYDGLSKSFSELLGTVDTQTSAQDHNTNKTAGFIRNSGDYQAPNALWESLLDFLLSDTFKAQYSSDQQ